MLTFISLFTLKISRVGFFVLLALCELLFASEKLIHSTELVFRPLHFISEVHKGKEEIQRNLTRPDTCVEFISEKLEKIDSYQSISFFPRTEAEKE